MPQLQTPVNASSLVNVQKRKNMAQSAELDVAPRSENAKNRKQLIQQSKTQFGRPVMRFGKRKRSAIQSQVHAAFKALRSKEEQMASRLASAQKFEAELDDRQRTLASIEQRLESRLEGLNQLYTAPSAVELPQNFGEDLARSILESLSTRLEQLISEKLDSSHKEGVNQEQLTAFATTNARLEQLLQDSQETLLSIREECEEYRSLSVHQDVELSQLREQLAQLLAPSANASSVAGEAVDLHAEQIAALREQLAEAAENVQALQYENDALRATRANSISDDPASCELDMLRQQIADLTAELSKAESISRLNAPHLGRTHESLTWEERKRLIMQQLEEELDDCPTSSSRLEISEVLRTTQAEIDRRDSEIRELQRIIEQQSNTSAGVAIGAAAIAQMVDSDEFVQQEREKLRNIQKEWEDKLRQAEIELSLERAKLARERSLLEEQRRQTTLPLPPKPETKLEGGKPVRKWLEHLGLNNNKDT